MFKKEFQGGPYLDVFSVQGKDPLSKLKITGPSSAVKKEFHNDIRTFIISLHGDSARNKITFPKNSKQSLYLIQQFLVLQIFLQSEQSFSLETVLMTQSNFKVRLIFSTSIREIVINAHHVKMPCSLVETDTWLNLCLDLKELVSNYFEGHVFGFVESITISANCKLKRIFTVKEKPLSSLDFPKPLNFPPNIQCSIQILDWRCFDEANVNIRSGTGNTHKRTPHKISTNDISNTHIAFGSRIENNPRMNSSKIKQTQHKSINSDESQGVSLTSRAIEILPSKPVNKRPQVTLELDINNNNIELESQSKHKFQPRPPDKNAKKNTRRPRVVKSADVRSRESSRAGERTKPQVFSKSADSRNRRKPSIDSDDDANKFTLPVISRVKKGISRSAVDLEKVEQEISEKREIHFKSKSLNVLPKIGTTRNNRYGKTDSSYSQEEAKNDNVFCVGDEEDELLALADENEVEDYLKNRTRSSCRDDDSMSSCNSANSDLYLYSSRPRSVIKQRKLSSQTSQRSRNNSRTEGFVGSESNLDKNNNTFATEHTRQRSRNSSRNENKIRTGDDVSGARKMKDTFQSVQRSQDNSRTEDNTSMSNSSNSSQRLSEVSESSKIIHGMQKSRDSSQSNVDSKSPISEPTQQENKSSNDTFISVPKQEINSMKSNEDLGVDLSWEYSESTSMLVIPKEFKTNRNDNEEEEEEEEEETESGIVLGDTSEEESHENLKMNEEDTNGDVRVSKEEVNEEAEILEEEKINKEKSIIPSSFVMRDSCDSDSMSWLQASQDVSMAMTNTLDKMKSPQMALRQRLKEQLGSLIVQSKDGESESDCASECSDDTTYTDLPPKRFRNYRYQDEIRSISSTLDLSATIPATPHVGEQARYDDNNNIIDGTLDDTVNEELLDLMFDPVLNCYYDPVTHKYYELN